VAHDALLETLGNSYHDIYMTQQDRPEGIESFDFVMSEAHGLRIKKLMDKKVAGRKIIGSFCVFIPEEFVLAADAVLVGLCTGADFAMEEVVKTYKADGIIHYGLQFCQPYLMESMSVEKAIEANPMLRLETDYSMEDAEQLRTRVEAFMEVIR